MAGILELVYEYRRLVARRELMQAEIGDEGRERLSDLEQVLGQEDASTSRRRYQRCEVRFPATLVVGDKIQPVNVIDVSAGGIRVEPAPSLAVGAKATVRIVDSYTGVVYHHRVLAGWAKRSARESSMGMPFTGAPRQKSLQTA